MSLQHRVLDGAHRTAHSVWFDRAARVGFVAKGVVYAIIGGFALQLAFGDGGALLGSREATHKAATTPLGDALLIALGVGLAFHALWNLVRATIDPDGRRDSAVRIVERIGWGASGVIHGVLAVSAFQAAIGRRGRRWSWAHEVIGWDGGRYVLMAIGLIVIGVGLFQLYQAYTVRFRRELDTARMSRTEETWALRVGQLGMVARGVVMPIVGWFLIQAGRDAAPGQVGGTGAALHEIARRPQGMFLLAVVAAGFVAYALYMGVSAKYRRTFA